MLYTAIGISDDIDMETSVGQVIEDCLHQLGERHPEIGIVYTSCMDADLGAIGRRISAAFPSAQLIGCTTDGEITAQFGFSEDAVALLLLSADNVRFATSLARDISQFPEESIRQAYVEAREKLDCAPLCAIVLPDGITSIGISLDKLFREIMGDTFPVFGGIAGDHFRLETTYQFYGDQVVTDSMPILLMAGELDLVASVFTGPTPFGPFYQIDSFHKNTIFRINDRSVIDFYRDEYGEYIEMYTNFPLAVYPNDGENYFLRNPLLVNEEQGTIDFVGNFPENCKVRLTQVLREEILRSAEDANYKLLEGLQGREPELVLIFSCTARRHVLGSETDKEVAILRNSGRNIPFFGFYCYGELAPFAIGSPVRFHNETFAAVAFCSREKEDE